MKKFKLGDLNGIFTGRQLSKDQLQKVGKFLYINQRHIQNNTFYLSEKDRYVNDGIDNPKYILQKGDILISNCWKKRKIYHYQKTDPPAYAGQTWIVLRSDLNDYLARYFRIKEFYDKFNLDCEKRLTHGHIPRLQTNKLKEVEILKLSDEELAAYINFFNT